MTCGKSALLALFRHYMCFRFTPLGYCRTSNVREGIMTPASEPGSLLVRFCDGFLQERNIKWVLFVGIAILFGSSLMLVTTHWDNYTPAWKCLTLLFHVGAVYAAGQWTYHRLGLRRTGTLLLTLTVLLIPLTFLALRWVQVEETTPFQIGTNLILLAVDLAFGWHAARRVFEHFLRGPQPTFLASYLILCLAGALAPGLPAWWAPYSALALWAVFTAGVVKVNRHVFWLTEEQRLPRIFGFFPIALLAALYLGTFAVNFAPHVPLQWLGLGCVLAAVPVLLTADGVARVFVERTGDLVRPLPWTIILPLVAGLLLCAAGTCLAAVEIPTRRPFALPPTAAAAALLMAVAARRTGKPAFVWTMLLGILLAYNFTPVYFQELARAVRDKGAAAVQEQRLPLAFYGLTYLPLLLTFTVTGAALKRLGVDLFARPVRRFVIGLSLVLLTTSLGHVKAIFPVAAVMTAVFSLQAVFFRDRGLLIPAVASCVVTACGAVPFASQLLGWELSAEALPLLLAGLAALLLAPGNFIDRAGRRLPLAAAWEALQLGGVA
jgi:hypothetical protein